MADIIFSLFILLAITITLTVDLVLSFIGKRTISRSSLVFITIASAFFLIVMIFQFFAKNFELVNAGEIIYIMYSIAAWICYIRQKKYSQKSE